MGQFGQELEPSQTTGMALVCCILGKFLGVICHCFLPRVAVPTFSARCPNFRNDARDPCSETWNYGRKRLSGNFAYMASLFTPLGIFYTPQIYFPSEGRRADFFALKNPTDLKPRTWALKASTIPLDHRCRCCYHMYEGWNFNSGNYLFTTDTK